MDQNLGKHDPGKINVAMRNKAEKSKKCNQCDYETSRASNLRTHLKNHTGEKSNKCNLCDFAGRQFEETFENTQQWSKFK